MQPFRVSLWTPQVTLWDNTRPVALDITELTFTPRHWYDREHTQVTRSLLTKWVCECGHVAGTQCYDGVPSLFVFGNMEAHAAGHAVAREMLCLR